MAATPDRFGLTPQSGADVAGHGAESWACRDGALLPPAVQELITTPLPAGVWPGQPPSPWQRLCLQQLGSPALPVGGFCYSEGLETLVEQGILRDVSVLQRWLEAEQRRGAIRLDVAVLPRLLLLLRQGRDEEAQRLDRWLLAHRDVSAIRRQQLQMGASLLRLLRSLCTTPLPALRSASWPLAWALASVSLDLPPAATVETYLYAWSANLISAAVRLVPLGHTDGQVLQARLIPMLQELASQAGSLVPGRLWVESTGLSLAQLGHGELRTRLFRS